MRSENRKDGITRELDELSSDLVGHTLDALAAGEDLHVRLVVQDGSGETLSLEFADDGEDVCLQAARNRVSELAASGGEGEVRAPVRYVLTYEGAVEADPGTFHDALLFEFGERGYKAYSAYALFEGKGSGDNFRWTDPAPAGEVDPLV